MKRFEGKATINFKLNMQDIDDIMACALEGGINYWCSEAKVIGEYLGEYASEQMGMITPVRLERIENEKVTPDPKEILVMAETYGRPSLCNYYCSQKCPIGQQYVPEIEIKELSSIVLEMLASLNSVNKRKDRLIEITADGKIDKDEMDDFIFIQEELERISITVETLQLWSEKMLANGVIDAEAYHARKRK